VCVAEQTSPEASSTLWSIGAGEHACRELRKISPTTEENNMKNLKIVSTLIAALMLSTVVGCASTSSAKHESAGQYIDDASITTGVKAAILNAPTLKVSEINVETYKGVVQLSGFVSSAENIATASSVARTVNGVKSVKNDLRLK
jgi:osmotically-inducible protein OsmY